MRYVVTFTLKGKEFACIVEAGQDFEWEGGYDEWDRQFLLEKIWRIEYYLKTILPKRGLRVTGITQF